MKYYTCVFILFTVHSTFFNPMYYNSLQFHETLRHNYANLLLNNKKEILNLDIKINNGKIKDNNNKICCRSKRAL